MLDHLLAGGERVGFGLAAQPGRALAHLAAEARLLRRGEIARLDALHLAQAERVDLVGCEVGGGLAAHREAVHAVAAGQRAESVGGARLRQVVVANEGRQAPQRRKHLVGQHAAVVGLEAVARVSASIEAGNRAIGFHSVLFVMSSGVSASSCASARSTSTRGVVTPAAAPSRITPSTLARKAG